MNRDTRIRIWDALKGKNGEYLGQGTTVTSIGMDTAISCGVSGTHSGSCDWDVEFSTGAPDKDGTVIFQGDIVENLEDRWFYIVKFGQAWVPFGDTRDGIDDIGGEYIGFYYEPLEKEQGLLLAKHIGSTLKNHYEHNRPFSNPVGDVKVVGNVRQNPEWVDE